MTRELKTIDLRTHIGVNEALTKNYISASILEEYYSFCFIRNPWDHALSQFFELKKDERLHSLDLDTFINAGTLERWNAGTLERWRGSHSHADQYTAIRAIFSSNTCFSTRNSRKL